MSEISKIENEVENASALLSAATDLMIHGRLVSILSLKRMIDSICLSFSDASDEDRARLKPMLAELFEKLNAFGAEMAENFVPEQPRGN